MCDGVRETLCAVGCGRCLTPRRPTALSVLDEKVMRLIPRVQEANSISKALGKGLTFKAKLVANHKRSVVDEDDLVCARLLHTHTRAHSASQRACPCADRIWTPCCRWCGQGPVTETLLYVRVEHPDPAVPPAMWEHDKFMDRLYRMEEMYQVRGCSRARSAPAGASTDAPVAWAGV